MIKNNYKTIQFTIMNDNRTEFIKDVLGSELVVLNSELHEWKLKTLTPARFLYRSGHPEETVEKLRKRISKIEICIEILESK